MSTAPHANAVAVIGAGWAGLSAAIHAVQRGWQVTLFEAAHQPGGRARALPAAAALTGVSALGRDAPADPAVLDNGQHILIGAYTETLRVMRLVGVAPEQALREQTLDLRLPNGRGLQLPDWPAPWDVLAGVLGARGWPWSDRLRLLATAARWQRQGFRCAPQLTVGALCQGLGARLMAEFIDPLCISALNTPADRASASVFLRVLEDAMFGVARGSRLLLPRTDLGRLFPEPAQAWLAQRGVHLRFGQRAGAAGAQALHLVDRHWWLGEQPFDAVVLAVPSNEAARITRQASHAAGPQGPGLQAWADTAQAMHHEAIATVYAWHTGRLPRAMMALPCSADQPAQFVFDRGQLGGPHGLLAFVVSACTADRAHVQAQVLAQARAQLGLSLRPLRTVIDKRATFACSPGLVRPPQRIARGLVACGDYVEGPYPATLEGAVRSGWAALDALQAGARQPA